MTTELIEAIRALRDKAIEEAEANGQADEKQRCAKCQCMWPTARLDDKGVCPNCLLDALYLRQRQWRMANYLKD